MRSGPTGAACLRGTVGVSDRPLRVPVGVHLVTLRRFDTKHGCMVKMALIIPCERRLANMEIWENQEPTFRARFGNGDYDRPY